MASRTLNIPITGDSRDFERAMGRATKATSQFEKKASVSSKATGLAFKSLAGVAGIGAVAAGLRSTIKAAQESQVSQSKMQAQLKSLGISYQDHAKHIDNVIQKVSRLSGLDDEDLQDSFTNLVRSTGDVNKALELNATAADLARAKHIDVAQAGQILAKVYGGQTNALKRLIGEGVDPVTAAQDRLKATTKNATTEQINAAKAADKTATVQKALGLVQQKLGGQAEAYGKSAAGAQERFGNAVENLQEKLGTALLPTITRVADKASKFVDQMTNGTGAGGRFAKKMEDVFKTVGDVVGVLRDAAKWLGKHPGLLKAAAAAWVTYKTTALVQLGLVKAAEIGLFSKGKTAQVEKSAGAAGTRAGRAFRTAFVVGATVGLYDALVDPFNSALEKLTGQINASDPTHGGAQQKADTRTGKKYGSKDKGKASPYGPRLQKTDPKFLPNIKTKKGHQSRAHSSAFMTVGLDSGRGARARASSGAVTGDTAGLNADFLNRLHAMSAGTGTPIYIQSGFRSAAEQQQLVNEKGVWSPSNPTGAAPVGSSKHEQGLAADITPGKATFGGVAAKYGLAFTVPGEPWHIQPSGSVSSSAAPSSGTTKTKAAAAPKKVSAYDKLTGRLDHIDLLVGAGVISEATGETRKISAINKALPKLKGDNKLRALGTRRELKQSGRQRRSDRNQTNAENQATAKAARTVDRTLNNPWLTAALAHIDNLVDAGQMTPGEGDAAKAKILQNALDAPKGLTGEDRIVAQGMIRGFTEAPGGGVMRGQAGAEDDKTQELIDAQNDAAEAAREQTAALNALKDEVAKQNSHTAAVLGTNWHTAIGAFADVISGQIAGYGGYLGKAATAGAGSTYRL